MITQKATAYGLAMWLVIVAPVLAQTTERTSKLNGYTVLGAPTQELSKLNGYTVLSGVNQAASKLNNYVVLVQVTPFVRSAHP